MTDRKLAEGFEAGEWIDGGHGVRFRLFLYRGEPDSVEWYHPCKPADDKPDNIPLAPTWSNGWRVAQRDPLTLTPSLLCRACGFHGFIRGGQWVPA